MKHSLCFCYHDRYFCVYSSDEKKRSAPFSMTYNPIMFPCISNNKSYSFLSSVCKIYFYENGLNSSLTLQMTIYLVDYKICCYEKKPGKKIPKPNPNPLRRFFPGDFFPIFLYGNHSFEKRD